MERKTCPLHKADCKSTCMLYCQPENPNNAQGRCSLEKFSSSLEVLPQIHALMKTLIHKLK
ncbi:MAG: hypothetical protein J6K73_05100 [Clostridia bacterium]|nr:hypothetical protein [Clostridia bacterium]